MFFTSQFEICTAIKIDDRTGKHVANRLET
jgi:hypothetical protein